MEAGAAKDDYVLIAEDDEDDRGIIRRIVSREGLSEQVRIVEDGVEAMAVLDSANLPRAMILDVKMPRMGGMDVLERVRSTGRTRHIPVVIFTSSDERKDRETALRLAANSYVLKPTDYSAYSVKIELAVKYWLSVNEPMTG